MNKKKAKTKNPKKPRNWGEFQPLPDPVLTNWHTFKRLFVYPRRFVIFCVLWLLSCFFSKKRHNWAHTAFVWVWLKDDFFDFATTIVGEDIIPFIRDSNNDDLNACVPSTTTTSASTTVNRHLKSVNNKATNVVLARQLLVDWLDVADLHDTGKGATFEDAFDYIEEFGLPEEHVHPYEARPKLYYKWVKRGTKYRIGGYENLSDFRFEDILTKHVVTSICAVPGYEDHYGRGIWDPDVSVLTVDPDAMSAHAGNVIGYGRENGVSFFVVAEDSGLNWGFWGIAKIKCSLCYQLKSPVWAGDEDYMIVF